MNPHAIWKDLRAIPHLPWILVLFSIVLLAMTSARALAAPPGQASDQGASLFQQKCAGCHTIGQGDTVGPDLMGTTARRDRAWLTRWLADPTQMLAEQDPIATEMLKKYNVQMPNLGLTPTEVEALIVYLDAAGSGAAPAQPATPALPPGDPAVGKELFTGVVRLQNGGPPCMACHSAAGISALGGGALGPDLTTAYSRLGDAGITSILATTPLPTMQPVYVNAGLTPQEQANLKAFLQQAPVTERPVQALGMLLGIATALAIGLGIVANIYWRRRLRGVRRPLLERAR